MTGRINNFERNVPLEVHSFFCQLINGTSFYRRSRSSLPPFCRTSRRPSCRSFPDPRRSEKKGGTSIRFRGHFVPRAFRREVASPRKTELAGERMEVVRNYVAGITFLSSGAAVPDAAGRLRERRRGCRRRSGYSKSRAPGGSRSRARNLREITPREKSREGILPRGPAATGPGRARSAGNCVARSITAILVGRENRNLGGRGATRTAAAAITSGGTARLRAPRHVINKQHGRPSRVLTRRVLLFTNRTEGIGGIDETLTRATAIHPAMAAKLDVPDKSGGIKEKDKDSEEKEGARLSAVVIFRANRCVYRNSGNPRHIV